MEANPADIHLMKPREVRPVAKEMMTPNQTTVSHAALSAKTSFQLTAPMAKSRAARPIPIALAFRPVHMVVPHPRRASTKPIATLIS